jgi:uncharacterized membrane protein YuzA (DUF378 family)
MISRIVYDVVGISALYVLAISGKFCKKQDSIG